MAKKITGVKKNMMHDYLIEILKIQSVVILPEFGSLMVANLATNQIVFNRHLKFNDGAFAKFIATRQGVDLKTASKQITKFLNEIESELNKTGTYNLPGLGKFHFSKKNSVSFEWEDSTGTAKKNVDARKDPKEYMKLAVEVMKKSISERKKNDPSPLVGAVLVFPDGGVDTAYRGELREGDHAEYTVLDKKNRHRDLTGCWIFATLEPCAPGARNAPKVSCSKRIVDARISDVWYGIEDKNPKVDHGGINHLNENGVRVHQFSPEFHKEIEDINKEFMKWANIKNREAKEKGMVQKQFLDQRSVEANMESLNNVALQKFINDSGLNMKVDSEEFLQELKEMELLEYDEGRRLYLPSGNAILLFGKRPRNKFPQAAIKAKVHYGNNKIGTETFSDSLVLIPDQIQDWLMKVLPASIDRSKFKAKQVSDFPPEVIREAIINAIIHRDYSLDGAKISLEISPEKIIVRSPGGPFYPITLEAMNNFTANSYSRNKKLAFVFNEMHLMEESALGMDTYKTLRAKYNLPLPIIEYENENIVVIFPRTVEAIAETIATSVSDELNQEELLGYEFVRTQNKISRSDYEIHFGYEKKKAERHLRKMLELGLVDRKGSGRSTYYVLARH